MLCSRCKPREIIALTRFLPLFLKPQAYANTSGLSRAALFHQVEESLKRLETTYIDVYFSEQDCFCLADASDLWKPTLVHSIVHRCDKTVPKE